MISKLKETLSENIRILREKNNITREQLSLILGFENSYISKLERKKINITIGRLDKIAEYFGIPTYLLLMENSILLSSKTIEKQ